MPRDQIDRFDLILFHTTSISQILAKNKVSFTKKTNFVNYKFSFPYEKSNYRSLNINITNLFKEKFNNLYNEFDIDFNYSRVLCDDIDGIFVLTDANLVTQLGNCK